MRTRTLVLIATIAFTVLVISVTAGRAATLVEIDACKDRALVANDITEEDAKHMPPEHSYMVDGLVMRPTAHGFWGMCEERLGSIAAPAGATKVEVPVLRPSVPEGGRLTAANRETPRHAVTAHTLPTVAIGADAKDRTLRPLSPFESDLLIFLAIAGALFLGTIVVHAWLYGKRRDYKTRLANKDARIDSIKQEVRQITAERDAALKAAAALATQNATLVEELKFAYQIADETIETLEQEKIALKEEVGELTVANEQLIAERDAAPPSRLRAGLVSLEDMVARLNGLVDTYCARPNEARRYHRQLTRISRGIRAHVTIRETGREQARRGHVVAQGANVPPDSPPPPDKITYH